MTFASRIIVFLICFSLIVATLLYGTVHQPTISFFYIQVGLMLVLWAYDAFRVGELRLSRHSLQAPLYATAIYGFIQIIPFGTAGEMAGLSGIPRTISAAPFETQLASMHFLALGLFFSITLAHINTAARIERIVNVVAIFGFAYAFFAILQSFLSPGKVYGIYERFGAAPFGSFVSRHNFAAFINMVIALPLGLLFAGSVKRDKKLLYITAVALMGVSLVLSGSRGGLVAFLAEILLLVFLTTRTKGPRSIAIRSALAIALLAAIVGGTFFVGGDSTLTRVAETDVSKDFTADRIQIWRITLNVIANNLPFGSGLGAFGQAYTRFDDFTGLSRVEQAHNDYLQVLADMGLVGLVIGGLFLYLLYLSGRRGLEVKNSFRHAVAIGTIAGIFAVLVHSLFDFVLHTTAVAMLFLLLIALLAACAREYSDDKSDDMPDKRRRPAGKVM
ncbi:MAG: O-antigen ligase family protein, partial [Blastocatellia bacterium]|nr:O-antigen ligase family protein [Blastocatellia bacterium]